jgi:hypothetical protein
VKSLLFVLFTAVVLNPNLKRAVLQVQHTTHPESLIQTSFPGIAAINRQIDRLLDSPTNHLSEPRLVARFVLRKIMYVTDYENWGNIEYWPTATEVWQRRQEDCDGRAIFATSLLRSRGFNSARMVVSLDHMWVRVNENEKQPGKAPHYIALLNPNPHLSIELHEHSFWADAWDLLKAFLHPRNLWETISNLFADIPAPRKAVLVTALLLLCYHPCRYSPGLLVAVALGLAAVNLLASWEPGQGPWFKPVAGGVLLGLAMMVAVLMPKLVESQSVFSSSSTTLEEAPAASEV